MMVIRIWIGIQELLMEFYHYDIGNLKDRFGNSPKICRLVDLKLDELRAFLAEVCALRVLLFLIM